MKQIAVLGSTGSIGTNTLDVAAHLGDRIRIAALTADSNWELLARQARRFEPAMVALTDDSHLDRLETELSGTGIRVMGGEEGLVAAASLDEADVVVGAVVGAAGLPASIAALESGKTLALANKESLVMAGEYLTGLAADRGVEIIPIDSEHSAIYQCLRAGKPGEVARLILTASGGPFREFSPGELRHVTPEMALRHPTWQMGAKVTIDSATLTNKALEIIEARWLFDVPPDHIDVLVHPQSIVHSMVEFRDGSVVAQLGAPDMRGPIQYALTCPDRESAGAHRLDLTEMRNLTFEPPDTERFPGLLLGWKAAAAGGTLGAVLNAANEVAVNMFLDRKINFTTITSIARSTVDAHSPVHPAGLDEVMAADRWARETARAAASGD